MMAEAAPSSDKGVGGSSSVEDQSKVSLKTVRENVGNLMQLQKVHKERLALVDDELGKLRKYRTDYEHLNKRLKTLPDKTTHEVMVPIGKLGFMPGRLVHTNEVLVLLGDNWFAERSAKQAREIVARRIRDCDDKIKRSETTKKIHEGWLQDAEDVICGEDGDKVEILEEITEEQFQISQEEHRKKVTEEYKAERAAKKIQNTSDNVSSNDEVKDRFLEKLEGKDRRSYEDIMRRLDQLELEEEEMGDEEEEEDEEEDEEDEANEDETEEEEEMESTNTAEIEEAGESGGAAESADENSVDKNLAVVPKPKAKLRRRVSWADDARPLYTIIPDENKEQTYRIKYSTGPLSMSLDIEGSEQWDKEEEKEKEEEKKEEIQSPSDIYKVFGAPAAAAATAGASTAGAAAAVVSAAAPKDPQPRGILKKSTSLPLEDKEGEGWCCPPKPLDVEGDNTPEDLPPQPPPPPSPPPRRSHSLKPAFSYEVKEHENKEEQKEATGETEAASSSDAQPKKVSKFKAARMKK